jgi:putative Mg2+ transporter-C (MgtC) family protein
MLVWITSNPIAEMILLPIVALLLAGLIGAQRERAGKSAGLRTHMLVALGAAVLVIACRHSGMSHADVSRVVQGIAAGVGFIGGGAILKLSTHEEVRGLTTATGIWLTTAVGVAIGLGNLALGVVATLLALIVLTVFRFVEEWIEKWR